MSKKLWISLAAGAFVLLGAGSGFAAWHFLGQQPATAQAEPEIDTREYRYVSLDKVIVMLRAREGGPLSNYMAVDLVFKTPVKEESTAKQQLPKLRSLAVAALSELTLERASMLSIPELTDFLQKAYGESFSRESREAPFAEVMVGRLVIE
ncbi:MAG: flagellar basal body-associated protein FliL [Hydrogenophaga sp.]|uniref:flagellar basal body protein n=1 Tax=Hydrogenophaga sp. TaxID=1904254 RepID=UPI0016AC9213|nr:flagellar basal body protein [Hydrogenophaga sp.]NIM43339.1 flagellar basal body-associated protein FliL [Hydrogenophaga sp.]NIN28408.1 flagellar basal body-associated protein FliL [Hydrogenophaga sp.]NIN29227.1 flagellar basal body-associated protein FliL [Hydrogenophaga sp.]NIN57542.1 flagellar basal body-associated protein FliL [Hydrogenophaga sp.]NIO53837.1 flagellar basal body-associated protein FliL [Hydrogenophaga sp.]